MLVEPRYQAGARLGVEFSAGGGSTVLWLEVVHADICCPAFREMWLTGCAFRGELAAVELRPFVTDDPADPTDGESVG